MLSVVIQAGGESKRMGHDKGLVPFLGQPLISRVIERMRPVADELLVTTNNPEAYAFLGLPLYPDRVPGRGALGGLYTALSAAAEQFVAVVACDMPFASPALIAALKNTLITTEAVPPMADVAIPHLRGGLEPFHAVYRRETCLPHVAEAIRGDKWRVDAWFSKVQLRQFKEDELIPFDPRLLCFMNVNTPDELAAAEMLAKHM